MENFIKELIEMDQSARRKVTATKELRDKTKSDIAAEKQSIYNSFEEEAKKRIAAESVRVKNRSAAELENTRAAYEKALTQLEKQFLAGHEAWTAEILQRCERTELSR